jgi:hypothetical protein
MKAIKAAQRAEQEAGQYYEHDASKFEFISAANKMKDVYNNAYFYSNRMPVPPNNDEGMLIYKLDPEMSEPEKYVDVASSGLFSYSAYKVATSLYGLAAGGAGAFSPFSTGFWAMLMFANGKFLTDMYYRQVYFIDEVAIVGK